MLFVKLQKNLPGANVIYAFADNTRNYGAVATAKLGQAYVRGVRNVTLNEAELQVNIDTLLAAGYNSLPVDPEEAVAVLAAMSGSQVATILSTDLAAIIDFSLSYTLLPYIVP